MNKLDYIDMQLDGDGTLQEIFERMGALEFQSELENSQESLTSSEMKTTSVRLPPILLDSLDAVNKRFGITRQDAFIYMVSDYIANSVANYVYGRVKSMMANGLQFDDNNPMSIYSDEFDALIESMPCNDETKARIRNLAHSHAIAYMQDLGGF